WMAFASRCDGRGEIDRGHGTTLLLQNTVHLTEQCSTTRMVFMSSPADELPEPPWSSLQRPRRRRLTREGITEAALALVDEEGLDALSMRNVAKRLDVQASALYGHVSGKQELIQLMLDRVALEIELPEPDPEHWEEQVKEFARAARRALGAHRDLAG